jgi:hypothetical protein
MMRMGRLVGRWTELPGTREEGSPDDSLQGNHCSLPVLVFERLLPGWVSGMHLVVRRSEAMSWPRWTALQGRQYHGGRSSRLAKDG